MLFRGGKGTRLSHARKRGLGAADGPDPRASQQRIGGGEGEAGEGWGKAKAERGGAGRGGEDAGGAGAGHFERDSRDSFAVTFAQFFFYVCPLLSARHLFKTFVGSSGTTRFLRVG